MAAAAPLAALVGGTLAEFTPTQFEKKFGPLAAAVSHALGR